MLIRCAQAVQQAAKAAGLGELTPAQLKGVEDRISSAMRQLGREDPNFVMMTRDQQMQAGAIRAMDEIQAEAQRKLDNAERQIVKIAETDGRIKSLQESYKGTKHHDGTRAEALKRDFVLTSQAIAAERKIAMGKLVDLIEAAGEKQGSGLGRRMLMTVFDAENPRMTQDVIREIYGNADGATGNKVAQDAARAWLDTIEQMRLRFNAAGGEVGKLEYGWIPRNWDTAKIRKTGPDGFVERVFPRLDRSRYVRDDGSMMDDDEVRVFLTEAYKTLSTEGLNKQTPGQFHGTGKKANQRGDHRQIHFADGEAELAAIADFGRGSLYDAMMGHVAGMARDTTLIERYGPDANATARLQFDLAAMEDGTKPTNLVGSFQMDPQTYWNIISGRVGAAADERLARTGQMVRNFQTAAKLGGAVISSVNDLGTLLMTTGYNKLPYWQLVKNIGSQASKETRDFMSSHGMIAESVADSLNRWSGDHMGSNWSGKMANSVMRWSLLNAWTDGLRQGFVLTMNEGLGRMAKMGWSALSQFDQTRLTRAGITEADWNVIRATPLTKFKGRDLLTPDAIGDSGVAQKVFGFIHDESEFAVVNPDLATRAIVTQGGKEAGTWSGEIARTVMQFKSFPITMMTRHWARMLEGDLDAAGAPLLANRVSYGIALMATATALGAVATQAKQVLQGKDPINMDPTEKFGGRFWLKALAQGGGLSIAGDLFLVDPSSSPGDATATAIKNVAGPTVGAASELALKVMSENIWQAADGKDTHWEAELLQWAKSNTPGSSLWWIKPMVEHGFTNAINENLSPGYLARMKKNAMKNWGQRYWWAPDEVVPDRAPDFENAMGQ